MNHDEAVREVGWVARRARELVGSDEPSATWAEFYDRKAALLRHIGDEQLAGEAESMAAAYRPGGAFYRPPAAESLRDVVARMADEARSDYLAAADMAPEEHARGRRDALEAVLSEMDRREPEEEAPEP